MRTRTWTAAAVALTFVLGACSDEDEDEGSTDDTTAATVDAAEGEGDAAGEPGEGVTIANFAFSPSEVTVAAGGSIAVANEDSTTHTFSSEDGGFDVELGGGDSQDVTIDAEPGDYEFQCDIHPSMTGTLTVE